MILLKLVPAPTGSAPGAPAASSMPSIPFRSSLTTPRRMLTLSLSNQLAPVNTVGMDDGEDDLYVGDDRLVWP